LLDFEPGASCCGYLLFLKAIAWQIKEFYVMKNAENCPLAHFNSPPSVTGSVALGRLAVGEGGCSRAPQPSSCKWKTIVVGTVNADLCSPKPSALVITFKQVLQTHNEEKYY